jgi:hypothetical protein
MPKTAAAILPNAEADSAVRIVGQMVSASLVQRKAVLTTEKQNVPLVLFAQGVFLHPTFGIYPAPRREEAMQAYTLSPGQENNWLAFNFEAWNFSRSSPAFLEFEYRLKASDTRAMLQALREDIVSYLRDIEGERPLVRELQQEVDGLSAVISSNHQSLDRNSISD